jgi:hypothetical protein
VARQRLQRQNATPTMPTSSTRPKVTIPNIHGGVLLAVCDCELVVSISTRVAAVASVVDGNVVAFDDIVDDEVSVGDKVAVVKVGVTFVESIMYAVGVADRDDVTCVVVGRITVVGGEHDASGASHVHTPCGWQFLLAPISYYIYIKTQTITACETKKINSRIRTMQLPPSISTTKKKNTTTTQHEALLEL